MANIAIFRINYKSDFILTLNSDAGWMTPFCIKFWTGAPSQAYFVGYDGMTYTHCAPVDGEPTKLLVQFDDHHLPIGDLKFQIGYHFTVADFPTSVEDEVINQASVIIEQDGEPAQVMLDFNGETAPEIQFSLPAYANEAQRIANEQARIAAEQQRIANEDARIAAEQTRQLNEAQRIAQETVRVNEFATLKSQSQAATSAANTAAALANEKAQLAADKAALADAAATLANEKAQLAADKAALAQAAATLANDKADLAQQKAAYAQTQGDYAKAQGDYAKAQGDTAQADHVRAEADHTTAAADHTTAAADHTTAAADHNRAENDHTTAASDHTRAESDHTTAASDHSRAEADHTTAASDHSRAESDHTTAATDHTTAQADHAQAVSDHAAVEPFADSLGAYDISAAHASGGVLATYSDLTAALGTNGANIPEGIRKGGMSVKFVLTSDNKYVSFRYTSTSIANADFANVNNWQGVDDVPTAGSNNLVKSGGVADKLNFEEFNLDYLLGKDIIKGKCTRNGGFYNNDGTVAIRGAGAAFYCGTTGYFDVSKITSLKVTGAFVQGANTLLLVAYDSSKNALLEYSVQSEYTSWHENITYTWTKESDSIKYVRFTCRAHSDTTTNTKAFNTNPLATESYVTSAIGVLEEKISLYNRDKLQNTTFSDNVKYIIKLSEDITLTKNVTLPKYCVLDFNGHFIDTTSYTLTTPEDSITDMAIERSFGYCIRGSKWAGKYKSNNPIYFTNILPSGYFTITAGNQNAYLTKLSNIFSTICNSVLLIDKDIDISSATSGEGLTINPDNIVIDSFGYSRHYWGLLKQLDVNSGKIELRNIGLNQKYGGSLNLKSGANMVADNVVFAFTNVNISSENNKLINSTFIHLAIYSDNNYIYKNNIVQSVNTNYTLTVNSSNNIIEENTVSGGVVGILLSPNAYTKVIENNIIRRNLVISCKEESISLDNIGTTAIKNFFTLKEIVSAKVVRGVLNTATDDYSGYIGSILYGIGENNIGMYCKITNVIDSEINGMVDITLQKEMFEYDIVDNNRVYNNNGVLNAKGYDDYTDTLFVIGTCYINNIIQFNTINGGYSIDIFGAAFCNIIADNVANIGYESTTGGIYMGAPRGTKDGITWDMPICGNIIKNNIVPYTSIGTTCNGNEGVSAGCAMHTIRNNIYAGNVTRTMYLVDKYSFVDSISNTRRRINAPYGYNEPIMRHPNNNAVSVYYIGDISGYGKRCRKGQIILGNVNGETKIFKGNFSDNYGQSPIFDDLVDNT